MFVSGGDRRPDLVPGGGEWGVGGREGFSEKAGFEAKPKGGAEVSGQRLREWGVRSTSLERGDEPTVGSSRRSLGGHSQAKASLRRLGGQAFETLLSNSVATKMTVI